VATTVLLVDDVDEVRAVLRHTLRLRGGFDVVAEASDGSSAIAAATEQQPDVVVLDLGLPDLAGHDVLTRLQVVAPAAQVVIYTGMVGEELAAGRERVAAIVPKDKDVRYLVDLITELTHEMRGANVELGPSLFDVAKARRFIADRCAEWGCSITDDDAELVATELVTNALVHASARCELRVRLAGGVLHIEVEDRGGGTPDLQAADERAEHGRGLLIVSALSTAWGVDTRPPGGKRVWAQIPVVGAERRGDPLLKQPVAPC
jgi:CheY-like chemotaxis protein/anti-sigma regulatory factor (Ser/Thr protein kinase)